MPRKHVKKTNIKDTESESIISDSISSNSTVTESTTSGSESEKSTKDRSATIKHSKHKKSSRRKPKKSKKNFKVYGDIPSKRGKKNISASESSTNESKSVDSIETTDRESDNTSSDSSCTTEESGLESGSANDSASQDQCITEEDGLEPDNSVKNPNKDTYKKLDLKYSCHYEVINNSKGTIHIIYHLSDIHLPASHFRVDEFKQLINNLYIEFSARKKDGIEALIVITGDIIDQKKPSNITNALLFEMFMTLNEIFPVLFISGNHDRNMVVNKHEDVFNTLILPFGRGMENVHYLQKTGVYRYKNIIFGVTSVDDNCIFKSSDIDSAIMEDLEYPKNKIFKVALYHGTLNKSVTHDGYVFDNTKMYVNVKDFDGYDFVMLGDIHKHQFLNRAKTIAYPGSIVEQNHGESSDKHGFLVWTMEKPTSPPEFVQVANEYGFFTIDMNKVDLKKIKSLQLPEKARVRIFRKGLSDENLDEFRKTLLQHHPGIIEVKVEPYVFPNAITDADNIMVGNDNDIINITTIDGLWQCAKRYLEGINTPVEHIASICKKFKTDVAKKMSSHLTNGQTMEILELEFQNMFIFGSEVNKIDFTQDDMRGKRLV